VKKSNGSVADQKWSHAHNFTRLQQ